MPPPVRFMISVPLGMLICAWSGAWFAHLLPLPDHWEWAWYGLPLIGTGMLVFVVGSMLIALGLALASEKLF